MPVFKPNFDHGGGGIFNPSGNKLVIKDSSGKVIFSGNAQRQVAGEHGAPPASKWVFNPQLAQPGNTFSIDGGPAYNFGKDYTQRQVFDPSKGGSPTSTGGLGSGAPGSGGTNGVPGAFLPGNVGQGSTPSYIGNMFPNPVLSALAQYKFTDPMKFAKQFGEFNRGEIQKNFNTSQDLAMKELSTELSSLKGFVPAASALKRNEVSLDNQFNQQQRTAQVNSVLPNAAGDLAAQRARATSFASGQVPDSITGGQNALELGIRSASADQSRAGGFGASSSVARKASDLLSTQQSINLSKYGDQLLSGNIKDTANLFLAPTEYSNAGGQVNVNPSVSASQLIDRNLAMVNGLSSIPATTGLQSTTQQNQFRTNQTQANNDLNAGIQNTFSLDKFGYNASYAQSVAGAAQTNTNIGLEQQQQQMYAQLAQQYMQEAQSAQSVTSALNGVAGLFQGLGGISGLSSIGSKGGGGKGSGGSPGGDFITEATSALTDPIGSLFSF